MDSRLRGNDELGDKKDETGGGGLPWVRVRDMISWQSLMPAAAGTTSYEYGCPSLEAFGCHLCRPSTSPRFPPSRE